MKFTYAICKHNRIVTKHGIIEQDEYMRSNGAWSPINTKRHNWNNAMLFHDKSEAERTKDDLRANGIDAFMQWVNLYREVIA